MRERKESSGIFEAAFSWVNFVREKKEGKLRRKVKRKEKLDQKKIFDEKYFLLLLTLMWLNWKVKHFERALVFHLFSLFCNHTSRAQLATDTSWTLSSFCESLKEISNYLSFHVSVISTKPTQHAFQIFLSIFDSIILCLLKHAKRKAQRNI